MTVLPILLCLCIQTPQQITLSSGLPDGAKVTYHMDMVEHLESQDANVSSTWTETTKKQGDKWVLVVENTEYSIEAGGMQVPAPPPGPMTIDLDRHGRIVMDFTDQTSVSKVLPDLFLRLLCDRPIGSGTATKLDPQRLQFSYGGVNPVNSEFGSAELKEIHDGVATLEVNTAMKYSSEKEWLHMHSVVHVRASDGRLENMEGKFTDLPDNLVGRYNVQSADFKLKRVN